MTGTSSSRSVLLYSIFFRGVCRVISIPKNTSGDLSSSRKMSACFQSICQRANAISEKLFYNASTLSQSLSCERAEKKNGWEHLHECTIYKITPRITVRTLMMVSLTET